MTFSEKVTELFDRLKAGEEALVNRQSRIKIIDEIVEDYFAANGEMPEALDLDRLSSLILHEELTDNNPYKMTHEDEPIVSVRQKERREDREMGASESFTHGADGRDYRRPTRKPTKRVNTEARIRNDERRRKYNEFTRVQPVRAWNTYDNQ